MLSLAMHTYFTVCIAADRKENKTSDSLKTAGLTLGNLLLLVTNLLFQHFQGQ